MDYVGAIGIGLLLGLVMVLALQLVAESEGLLAQPVRARSTDERRRRPGA